MERRRLGRREFVKSAVGAGMALGVVGGATPAQARVLGANDRINVALIGAGGRGRRLLQWVMETGGQIEPTPPAFGPPPKDLRPPDPELATQVVAVCDVYARRKNAAAAFAKSCDSTLDYREVLDRSDVDAVIIATPDHWHARMALEAMAKGKDVYLEKPMTHTVEEAKTVAAAVKKTGRVLQVGSQTTSSDQWWKARQAILDGMIGKLLMSQGSYHRNSEKGEWNWTIEPDAGPEAKGEDFVDWKMWLGDAPPRAWDADRFFRFRKYWDYSGGIATDLFYHVVAPLQICWGEAQFPRRVYGSGGNYVFTDDGREVPDTFMLTADYPKGHSLVLSSSMANDTHIPGLIRGHEGTIMMVPDGKFEGKVDFMHMENFLRCVRTRKTPILDADTAYRAMVPIGMAVQSYREGRVLYFDEAAEKVVASPPKA